MVSGLQEQSNWLVWLTDSMQAPEEEVPSFPPTFLFPFSSSLLFPPPTLHSYFLSSTLVIAKLFCFSSCPALWFS